VSVFTPALTSRRLAGVAGGATAGVVAVTSLLGAERLPAASTAETVKR
jgi:hypothetical protein